MSDQGPASRGGEGTVQCTDLSDARLVARMRLVLALAVLLAVQIEPWSLPGMDPSRWPLFVAYGLYSLAVDAAAQQQLAWPRSRLLHWLDVLWYAGMVMLTGGVSSVVFLFFLFAILTASFRWGHREGGRVTVASALAFVLGSLLARSAPDLARLLLRSSFLLGLGYLCVHWGETQMQLKRRLALLREVSRLSNPRFGVEHTLQHVLESIRSFHGASACLLVLRDEASRQLSLRSARRHALATRVRTEVLSEAAAQALLPFEPGQLVCHRSASRWQPHRVTTQCLDAEGSRWLNAPAETDACATELAALMEAGSLISVPVSLRLGQGRLHVGGTGLRREDALFLGQLVSQAFPVIDHIDLLDRMASEAAARERQKFALDLHDTAIQPYIGLKLALSALHKKADARNPLAADIEKLEAMAARVVEDLRRYARQVRQHRHSESALLAELRQQASQVREFYGVDIAVRADSELPVGDRLSAEVLQVVREGLANICKHTLARRGEVRLECKGGWLGIRIANEGTAPGPACDFTPRSISERAAALGGRAHVQHDEAGRTAVHIHIPV